jgi:hypothetical protein
VQIVNGYLCMNCCDVDKAREGQDPHQATDQIQKQIDQQLHPLAPRNFGPDAILGGSLAPSDGGNGVNQTNGNGSSASGLQAGSGPASQGASGPTSGFDLTV